MKYSVMFPQTENVHLIKDVGMIPYKLYENFSYDSNIICYENGSYEYLNSEVKGLKIDFMKKKFNNDILDGIFYLRENASQIDVLQLFHVTMRSVFYASAYKKYNPNGKIVLKLDCTNELIRKLKQMSFLQKIIINNFLNKVDIITVEQKKLLDELKNILKDYVEKLILLPNGIDYSSSNLYENLDFEKKENIILTVGRLGSVEKRTELLVEAFKNVSNVEKLNWKLLLVGPMEKAFEKYMFELFEQHPELEKCILIKGSVYDRDELNRIYKKAKIFCCTSRFESFGIAMLEAAAFGDVIISTDVGIVNEIVTSDNGIILKDDQVNTITRALEQLVNQDSLEKLSNKTFIICKENFDWNKILINLDEKLRNKRVI